MLVRAWNDLVETARANGLGSRVITVPENPKTPTYGSKLRRGDPSEEALAPLLPDEYRAFVAQVGFVAVDFGEAARLAFLPPRVMRQVTGAMGDPKIPFEEARKLRENGTYTWPFVFFAGEDLADVSGFCFARDKSGTRVFRVSESLPASKSLGSFEEWLAKTIASLVKTIATPAKAEKRLRQLREDEGLEEGEKLPPLDLGSFGA